MEWDDATPTPVDASGSESGWGVNLSSNLKLFEADTLRLQVVYGEGIANYMNDATADVGATGGRRHRRGAAGAGDRRLLRPHVEQGVDQHDRLLDGRHRQQRGPGARGVPHGTVRAGQPAEPLGRQPDVGRRGAVGRPRELLRRVQRRTICGSRSRSSTASHTAGEASHDHSSSHSRSGPGRWRCCWG